MLWALHLAESFPCGVTGSIISVISTIAGLDFYVKQLGRQNMRTSGIASSGCPDAKGVPGWATRLVGDTQ